jgi:hypothetical protein
VTARFARTILAPNYCDHQLATGKSDMKRLLTGGDTRAAKAHLAANEDEKTVGQLDSRGKIRAEIQGEGQKGSEESRH